ncbi:hypothetical protein F443_11969 [Phytophthora nicotianae P1569]|uniref:SET domain-containing protein n=1 Tax=Phytophthora nicotianae P1569 TaxID=1317065 RepID=V9EVU5_PHYNI|nr:hypothetical protein F443_11969 [Phytophthora nicotianae P1569]
MVHLTHSALHWKLRCIMDSPTSEDENTPPNIARASTSKTNPSSEKSSSDKSSDDTSSTGTATPSWMPPGFSKLGYSKAESNPPPASQSSTETEASPLRHPRTVASPTTSSPVLLEDATPRPSPLTTTRTKAVERRQARREEADPYSRDRTVGRQEDRPVTNPSGSIRPASVESSGPRLGSSRTSDVFVPARWPHQVAHLRELYNPLATVFPDIPHFGSCNCEDPCRADTCRNALVNVYCNINCCPYEGMCGNTIRESKKVFLARSWRTSTLGVAAGEDIDAGEVLGQYLGEIEHLSMNRNNRPRNSGYRLVLRQRPERPAYAVRVAINAERMGGLMRFVNHSCEPVAKFVEVGNGRRTTVVVVTTEPIRRGQEVTADYGDDLWFVCRCGSAGCRHRDIQGFCDP